LGANYGSFGNYIQGEANIDPLQLGTQFIKASTAKDLPRMIKSVRQSDWQDFFVKEAKKLKPDILD